MRDVYMCHAQKPETEISTLQPWSSMKNKIQGMNLFLIPAWQFEKKKSKRYIQGKILLHLTSITKNG